MLAIFAVFGIPASTTHAITGTIMGSGAARRKRAVRWKVSRQIIFSWIITNPWCCGNGNWIYLSDSSICLIFNNTLVFISAKIF